MLLACRYTGSALSSDYVLTNVPLAAEWPSVERADRTAPHWLQHSLMSYYSEIHKSSIPPLLYPCVSLLPRQHSGPCHWERNERPQAPLTASFRWRNASKRSRAVCVVRFCALSIINFMFLGLMCSIGRLFQYPFLSSYRFCFSVGSPYIHTCDKACVFGCRPLCEVVRLYLRYWKGWRGVWLLAGRLKQLFRRD